MAKLQKFREQKSTIMYMDYTYFESDGSKLIFSASDMENTATLEMPGIKYLNGKWKICIENTLLLPLTALECNISFELSGDVCIMRSPDGKVTIPALEAENFPRPEDDGERLFEIEEGKLLESLRAFIHFIHPDPLNSNNSLHFKYVDGNLRVGATDKNIAAATQLRIKAHKDSNFMISGKSAGMVMGVLEDCVEKCQVSIRHHDIIFKTNRATVTCRKMAYNDMQGPNDYYRMMMPFLSTEADIMSIPDKNGFMSQLHKATVFNTKANQVVELKLARNKVTIEVDDTMMGRRSVQECAVIFKHEGDTEKALVNYKLFMTLLKAVESNEIELRVPLENGPGNGCIGIPLTMEHGGYIFMLATLTY